MIHRAILGSLERFIGVLLEHTGGVLPFWLAPEQVRVLSLSEKVERLCGRDCGDAQRRGLSRQSPTCATRSSASRFARRRWPRFRIWWSSASARPLRDRYRCGCCAARRAEAMPVSKILMLRLKSEPLPCLVFCFLTGYISNAMLAELKFSALAAEGGDLFVEIFVPHRHASRRFVVNNLIRVARSPSDRCRRKPGRSYAASAKQSGWPRAEGWIWSKSHPTAQPPVCRVTDFDKYRYAQKKKTHDSKRGSTASAIKEVKMGALTEKHDVDFKDQTHQALCIRGSAC